MKKRIIGFVVALILAFVGTTLLVAYVKGAEDRALAGEEVVEVFVVGRTIEKGTHADDIEGRLDIELIPRKVLVDGAVAELDDIDGLVAAVDLLPGEQLTRQRFVEPSTIRTYARAERAPDGMLEVTLSLEPERVVGGSIVPGDTVAIVASFEPFDISGVTLPENFDVSLTKEELDELEKIYFIDGKLLSGDSVGNTTHILEHKVLVTNLQEEEKPRETVDDDGEVVLGTSLAPTGNLLVTVAVDAPAVERIVFTQEFGAIWLAAEPGDASEDGTRLVTRANVFAEDGLQ